MFGPKQFSIFVVAKRVEIDDSFGVRNVGTSQVRPYERYAFIVVGADLIVG